MSLAKILAENKSGLALLIGNGINRDDGAQSKRSWEGILDSLARQYLPSLICPTSGVSKTEFFDILDLGARSIDLQKAFCSSLSGWEVGHRHKLITTWAKNNSIPILTTNFDDLLSKACDAKLKRTIKGKFTAHYPWESFYGLKNIQDPKSEFGIWHINGMRKYRQSARLGLTHYMGQVQRARNWLHQGEKRLFSGDAHDTWRGSKTWLQMIFQSDLLVFGLALDQDEVFLRWLLLERARYFRQFPSRRRRGWYVSTNQSKIEGKKFFLTGVGMEVVEVADYAELYSELVWRI